jgi:hypothetical protein|tara:strand:- start:1407 stop:1544 length:138 start_codon:yes stop_codon:yes gene_type:complete
MKMGKMKKQQKSNWTGREVASDKKCICGELLAVCKDAYLHMSKGY